MNYLLIIILSILSIAANATMDEIRFHWGNFFGRVIKPGSKLDKWANPSISWYNKYKFKSRILNYLYGTVCVWFTDLWHLLKAIHLNLIFAIILILTNHAYSFKEFMAGLLLLNLGWGFIFEMTGVFYSVLSDIIRIKNGELHK